MALPDRAGQVHCVEQQGSLGARLHVDDLATLLQGGALLPEIQQLLDQYLVLHILAEQPITKPVMGELGFALGFPLERRHVRGGRPGSIPCDTPGFEFIGDFVGKPGSDSPVPRRQSYIESLHYDGISQYSLQVNIQVPPTTPNLWCDMRDAYRSLPAELRELVATHWALHASVPGPQASFADFPGFDPAHARRQPLLIELARSRQPALFLPRNPASRIEGMSAEQSAALLEQLWQHVTHTAARYSARIGHNEMVIWDGLGTTHTNPAYPPGLPRITWFFSIPASSKQLQPFDTAQDRP